MWRKIINMKQKIDLVSCKCDGQTGNVNYTLRFHPAQLSWLDYLFGKRPQLEEDVYTFIHLRGDSFLDSKDNFVNGKVKEALIAFKNTLLYAGGLEQYECGFEELPSKSLYAWTHKLDSGPYFGVYGVYAYPEFKAAPEELHS